MRRDSSSSSVSLIFQARSNPGHPSATNSIAITKKDNNVLPESFIELLQREPVIRKMILALLNLFRFPERQVYRSFMRFQGVHLVVRLIAQQLHLWPVAH